MKISLRKIRISDSEEITRLYKNDKVIKNLSGSLKEKDITFEKEKRWVQKVLKNYNKKNPESFNLAIVLDEKLIGVIGAIRIDWENKKTEIGYWIGETYWGKGYVSEAIKMFVKELFKKYKFVRIEALPYSYNLASQRVLEKAGFKFEGERKKGVKHFGKFIDDKIYAIVR